MNGDDQIPKVHDIISAIRIDDRDDVAVALHDLQKGDVVTVNELSVTLIDPVRRGHKIALRDIGQGNTIGKYGHEIGVATQRVAKGAQVHEHNLKTALDGVLEYRFSPDGKPPQSNVSNRRFQGYRRVTGRVGTRNDIWIIPTVGCVANVCEQIVRRSLPRKPEHIDDVLALSHPFGCSQLGDDLAATRTILAALSQHPNVGGILFVGLGCESNQLKTLLAQLPQDDVTRVRTVVAQSEGDEIEAGVEAVLDLFGVSQSDQREPCDLSDLVIGLKCGGSDSLSGLTANPLLGRLTDLVCEAGGSAILTEIPEIFGAEQALLGRATDQAVFKKAVGVINGFKQYFIDHDQPVYENPSPGNKEGGITTLEEKSLGAVQKGGHAPLADVIAYGDRVSKPGLTLLEAPGNDAVSSTALAAAGANLILFTTGRGTPLGFPVPTLKIASNSELATRKPNWIDFDAGQALFEESTDALDDEFLDLVLTTASGETTANERNGEKSIAIWKRGVTL